MICFSSPFYIKSELFAYGYIQGQPYVLKKKSIKLFNFPFRQAKI